MGLSFANGLSMSFEKPTLRLRSLPPMLTLNPIKPRAISADSGSGLGLKCNFKIVAKHSFATFHIIISAASFRSITVNNKEQHFARDDQQTKVSIVSRIWVWWRLSKFSSIRRECKPSLSDTTAYREIAKPKA